MLDKALCSFIGFVLGFFLMVGISHHAIHRDFGMGLQDVRKLTAECVRPLPRDQQCKIIAVPEVTK